MELALELIRQDGGTQPRAFINANTVEEYAEVLTEGGTLPPAVVFYDGTNYWLADGYHRIEAAESIGFKTYTCDVHQGTQQDAQWYSFGANKAHGLPRTNQDKQRVVMTALQHPKSKSLSNYDLAEHCGVSESFIRKVKGNAPIYAQCADSSKKTVTRKGKTYQQNVANIGKAKASKAEAEPKVDEPPTPEPPRDYKPTFRTEVVTPFPVAEKITAVAAIHGAIASLRKTPPDVEAALRELESADI